MDSDLTHTETRINFVPCVKWVRRGVANPNPEKVQLSKDELVEVIREAQEKLRIDGDNEGEDDGNVANLSENGARTTRDDEFNLDNYDEEDDANTASALGIGSLAELSADNIEEHFSDSDDSEKEDVIIKPNDNLILVGHVEGDASILEVYVYNEDEVSLYVHHDIFLPAFPLCLEWLDYEPQSAKGNYCAIGSMSPIIDIWDLDIINAIEPAFTLGKKGNRKKSRPHIGHTDAVLALAWNRTYDHVIASGSVDETVLLWDMEKQTPNSTIRSFEDKVQCLQWHQMEAQTLLAGGCDKTAKVFDCRTPDSHRTWQLNGEAERLLWHPLQPFVFLVGTSTGSVQCFDCRQQGEELWSISAHEQEVTGLAISGQCPGLLVTTSPDGNVKSWDFVDEKKQPELVDVSDLHLGAVHCLELCPDSPFLISLGGDKKSDNFRVYDLRNIDDVKCRFESRQLVQLVPEANDEIMSG